jgi:hypothetical protein
MSGSSCANVGKFDSTVCLEGLEAKGTSLDDTIVGSDERENETRRPPLGLVEGIDDCIRKDGLNDFEKVVALLDTVTDRGDNLPSESISSMADDTESLDDEMVMGRVVEEVFLICMAMDGYGAANGRSIKHGILSGETG